METTGSFQEFNIPAALKKNLLQIHFVTPTPVQSQAIPLALAGRDVLATAQTGTGKTGAFAIPLITKLSANSEVDALVLAPTRELAAQIFEVLQKLTRHQDLRGVLVVGGESFHRQTQELKRGADFIVATPGRLNDHLNQRTVSLNHSGFLVLDEVDRMLDMGFAPQIQAIVGRLPNKRQTLLFSATLPTEIAGLAQHLLTNPARIAVGPSSMPVATVVEKTLHVTDQMKSQALLTEISARQGRIVIFARTKFRTDRLARLLDEKGHGVVALHGGRAQSQRKQAMAKFKTGSHRILVATDLAGRGIDIPEIMHVINYDAPATREDYIHRIGRTARLGKGGNVLNLVPPEGASTTTNRKPSRIFYAKKRSHWARP